MMFDPIADMLTRIRNANKNFAKEVSVPHSQIKEEITKILKEEGYISGYEIKNNKDEKFPSIFISLKYKDSQKVITNLKKISKPGLRVYATSNNIPKVLNGLGIAIISTSNGIMTDKQAREANIGGEVLAYIW